MTVTLKRQLNGDEKAQILERHGRKCFATGHEIPADETVQYDHIRAYAESGATELNNIAPMCEQHNKQKGTLSLEDFRVKLRLEAFFS
jgi:5-methylcytosine-specific restriction endonuclease McrA